MSTVLLLHAFPCDASMWAAQQGALVEASYPVVAPDLPGFRDVPLLAGEPDLAAVAEHVLIDGDIHVVGLSLGGYLAMEIARQHPERVRSLVLVDTKAGADDEAAQARRAALADAVLAAGNTEVLHETLLPLLIGPTTRATRPDVVRRVRTWIDDAPATTVAWYQRAMARRPDSHAVLAELRVPITVVWGEEDELSSRADQNAMLAAAPSASLHVVPEAGHLSAIERPEVVTEVLLAHRRPLP